MAAIDHDERDTGSAEPHRLTGIGVDSAAVATGLQRVAGLLGIKSPAVGQTHESVDGEDVRSPREVRVEHGMPRLDMPTAIGGVRQQLVSKRGVADPIVRHVKRRQPLLRSQLLDTRHRRPDLPLAHPRDFVQHLPGGHRLPHWCGRIELEGTMMNLQPVTVGELRESIVETVITQPAPWTDDVGPYLDLQPNHSSEAPGGPCSQNRIRPYDLSKDDMERHQSKEV